MKKKIIALIFLAALCLSTTSVYADVAAGDIIVCLGNNLSETEKQQMLDEFNAPEDAQQVIVTNEEEYQYLGDYISASHIGSKAISSAMIEYTEEGSGLNIDVSDKINYITDDIYRNALMTAGVKDADIKVSAPISVSGTAALTGIMKAYEISTGKPISEEVKQVANEEMIKTAELGDAIGNEDKAADIMNEIKAQIASEKPKTTEEVRDIVNDVLKKHDLNLTDEQKEKLVSLFDRMKDMNINWDQVSNQLSGILDKASDYLSSDKAQSFLQKFEDGFGSFVNWLAGLFG